MTAGTARQPIVPVDPDSFTDAMEQLQEGYVYSVAATAGCQVDGRVHGNKYSDLLITRGSRTDEEVSLCAHLKCTTTIAPDHDKGVFSYTFKDAKQLRRLARPRRYPPKHVLIVMATRKEQALWTDAGADHLKVFHCCYWAGLEGMAIEANVAAPTVHVPTANVFDAAALNKILDRLDRGEPLR